MSRIFILLVLFFEGGCAYVPTANVSNKELVSSCQAVLGNVGFNSTRKFEVSDMRYHDVMDAFNETNDLSKIVKNEINKLGAINIKEKSDKQRIFGFSLVHEQHNWGLTWLTVLSLGLIPIKQESELSLNVRVFDENNNLIFDEDSSKLTYNIYRGWFVFPFVSQDNSISASEIYEKFLPNQINELLISMSKKGILKCKGI